MNFASYRQCNLSGVACAEKSDMTANSKLFHSRDRNVRLLGGIVEVG